MSPNPSSRRLRWAVPAVVAAAVAAAAISTTGGAGASEQPTLPAKTAAQLLASVERAQPGSFTGTVVETVHLGLPTAPTSDGGGGDGLSYQSLLTGSHTMRIWYGGPNRQRLALLAPLAERDVIHNGQNLWTFASTTNTVTHTTLGRGAPQSNRDLTELTPQQAAVQALRAVDPTTRVSVDTTARVAGRAAYQLDLAPRDARSLIGSIRIAVDAATSLPLRVQVFARGAAAPAIEVGFTNVTYGPVSSSIFAFVPPPGATVTQQRPGSGSDSASQQRGGPGQPVDPQLPPGRPTLTSPGGAPQVLGSGWTSVVEAPAGRLSGPMGEMFWHLSKPVPGGRLVSLPLLSVLLANDGRLYIGAVTGSAVQHVAATGHGL